MSIASAAGHPPSARHPPAAVKHRPRHGAANAARASLRTRLVGGLIPSRFEPARLRLLPEGWWLSPPAAPNALALLLGVDGRFDDPRPPSMPAVDASTLALLPPARVWLGYRWSF